MISLETAAAIWNCYREINVGAKLLADLEEALEQRDDNPNPRDAFGRQRPFSLGVPSGSDSSQRMFDVAPRLAVSVIRAHIAEKRRELIVANEQARIELGTAEESTTKG